MRGSAHVQGLSVCQFHFLKVGFPVVARTALALAGCRFLYLHCFSLPSLVGGFRFAAGLRFIIRLALPLGGYTLRDKFPHKILVYLRHPAALLCHIILI